MPKRKVYNVQRGTRYCWAWRKHSLETNKWTIFLETEAAFPYCNWSIKMTRITWFGSTSVYIGPAYVNSWQRLGHLPFLIYVKLGNSFKQKHILLLASKRKCRKKNSKFVGASMVCISFGFKLSSILFPFKQKSASTVLDWSQPPLKYVEIQKNFSR